MKNIFITGWLILLLLNTAGLSAQDNSVITVFLKVSGNCEMCKERIETAARGKGVRQASWSPESKLLTLTYDSLQTRVEKVQTRIAEAGHDNDYQKST